MRRDYRDAPQLRRCDLAADWCAQFGRWFADSVAANLPEPNAMVLATADVDGRPSSRTVLLKGYDETGFVFFTNHQSRKGVELAANPAASLLFPWFAISRQVEVRGAVVAVSRAETEAYFATRPRGSQLGAWASPQSQVVADRAAVDAGSGRGPEPVPGAGRGAAAATLGWSAGGAGDGRVLAGPGQSAARPVPVPAGPGRQLADRAPGTVAHASQSYL
jgi:pyridoxamine-phosphate oxidase